MPDEFDRVPEGFDGASEALATDSRRRVRRVYDRIAEHFSATRAYPWTDVEEFLADRRGTLGLDVGCGNGRHTELLAARVERAVGVDVSRGLLAEARTRAPAGDVDLDLLLGDAVALPVRSGTVDLALYVATIHHLPDRSSRIRSLNELARVLAPDGVGLVSAWSITHERFDHVDREPANHPEQWDDEGHRTGLDTTVGWTLPDGTEVDRFYHVYDPEEFRADLAASDLAAEPFRSKGNCYAIVNLL